MFLLSLDDVQYVITLFEITDCKIIVWKQIWFRWACQQFKARTLVNSHKRILKVGLLSLDDLQYVITLFWSYRLYNNYNYQVISHGDITTNEIYFIATRQLNIHIYYEMKHIIDDNTNVIFSPVSVFFIKSFCEYIYENNLNLEICHIFVFFTTKSCLCKPKRLTPAGTSLVSLSMQPTPLMLGLLVGFHAGFLERVGAPNSVGVHLESRWPTRRRHSQAIFPRTIEFNYRYTFTFHNACRSLFTVTIPPEWSDYAWRS